MVMELYISFGPPTGGCGSPSICMKFRDVEIALDLNNIEGARTAFPAFPFFRPIASYNHCLTKPKTDVDVDVDS